MSYKAENGIYKSLEKNVEHFPEDLDLYSFMFDYFPKQRPDIRKSGLAMLIDEETGSKYTFEDVRDRVDLLAVGLRERCGVTWDTCIGIFSANCIDYATLLWASFRLGGIITAANPAFQPTELAYQLDASKATLLVVNEDAKQAGINSAEKAGISKDKTIIIQDIVKIEQGKKSNGGKVVRKIDGYWTIAGLIEEGRDHVEKNGKESIEKGRRKFKAGEGLKKLAFLSFSSGTTGLPKGVCIQHSSPIANVLQFGSHNHISSALKPKEGRIRPALDVVLGTLPMFHIYGLVIGLHDTFFWGTTLVVIPKFRGIGPMLETCVKYKISHWYLVPPQVVLYIKSPDAQKYHADCRKFVRFVMIGAAPLSDDLCKQFTKLLPGIDLGQGYGMTETATLTLMYPTEQGPYVLGSAGRLISDTEARIVTPEGKDCDIDNPGELWIRGRQNTLGYLNNEKATEEMYVADGWIRTGDEAQVDKNGDFFIVDRLKELIKVKGFQVAPAELEGWLLNHEDVSDSCVIGIYDEAAGERPFAFLTLPLETAERCKNNKEEEKKVKESIMKHVSDHKTRYKHLKRVEIIDVIPKVSSIGAS
jgi:4-coumarate--CoA ligase